MKAHENQQRFSHFLKKTMQNQRIHFDATGSGWGAMGQEKHSLYGESMGNLWKSYMGRPGWLAGFGWLRWLGQFGKNLIIE